MPLPPAPTAKPYAETALTNHYQFSQGAGYVLPEYVAVVPEAVHTGATEHHRVLIVGGGITGLTLACALAQLGVDCVLLDEDNTVGVKGASSRGICYTQKSLEIFDKLGIYGRIASKGVQWSVGRTFAGSEEVYRFDLKNQNNFNLSQQSAFINIQQFYIEAFLVERIGQLGHAQIRWNNRATQWTNQAGLATLNIATPAGEYKVTADFVIDATGSKSPFRQWLDIGVQTHKGDDRWCIADVRFAQHPPKERHTWIEAPFNDNRAVWQHLMADDVWRIDYQMAPDADPEFVSSTAQVRARLARQFGQDTPVEIVWVGPYAYRSECVERMQVDLPTGAGSHAGQAADAGQAAHAGRAATRPRQQTGHASQVFLIGDSAKVMSPFGARGGNSGIADADNLAWKLAAVCKGQASTSLLASYHPERHEAATTNVRVTQRTARFLRPAGDTERLFRTAVIDLAKQHPFARSLVNTGRMAVANTYRASPLTDASLKRSISVQNVGLQWVDGAGASLNDLLRWAGARPLLLVFGDGTGVLSSTQVTLLSALASANLVRVVQVSTERAHVQAREAVLDAQRQLAIACGMPQPQQSVQASALSVCHWALLRPDSYLVARGTHVGGSLVRAVARCAGVNLQGARP